jgi:hypothetical protein
MGGRGVTMRHPPWKFVALWAVIAIELLMILGLMGRNSGTDIGPYNRVCWQNGVYNNQAGFDNTVYYPCTSLIP